MKITNMVLTAILISILLLPFQTGQIQAYDQSLNLKANDPANRLNPGINSTWLPILSTSNLNPALNAQTGSCHFGVTVPNGLVGYDLSILGVDSYLDWWHNSKPSTVADNIQYYKVLQVGDLHYSANLAALPRLVSDNPGAVWIIGNEPDAEVTFQDHISAETYAERFYAMATYIRAHDHIRADWLWVSDPAHPRSLILPRQGHRAPDTIGWNPCQRAGIN